MKAVTITLLIASLAGCRGFDRSVLQDPKFHCINPETKKDVHPRVQQYGDYTFVFGCETLGCFYLDKEFLFLEGGDGFYDTVYQADFNDDNIPDFVLSYPMEDFSVLEALISKSKDSFDQKYLGEMIYCDQYFVGPNAIKGIEEVVFQDINHDKRQEVLVNTALIKGTRINTACADTFYVNP